MDAEQDSAPDHLAPSQYGPSAELGSIQAHTHLMTKPTWRQPRSDVMASVRNPFHR